MKKFLSFALAFIMVAAIGLGVASKNADVKVKAGICAPMGLGMAGGLMSHAKASNKTAVYQDLQTKYGKDRVIAESYIRMEAYLTNGKAEYQFFHRLLGNEAPTERKLNDQDAFRITDLGLFLLQESTTVAGIGVLNTYPNPIQFPDEAGGIQNAHLEHIYNGFVSAKIGDTTWLPDLPIHDCRVVNTAQQNALATNDSGKMFGDGFIPVVPQYTLKGRENNEIKLIVPANSVQKVESIFGTSGYKIKVVMFVRGFKITGAGNTN